MDSVGQEFWKGSSVLFPLGATYVIAVGCYLGAGLGFPCVLIGWSGGLP